MQLREAPAIEPLGSTASQKLSSIISSTYRSKENTQTVDLVQLCSKTCYILVLFTLSKKSQVKSFDFQVFKMTRLNCRIKLVYPSYLLYAVCLKQL